VAFSLFYRFDVLTGVRKIKTFNKLIATTLVSVSEDDQDGGAQAGVDNGLLERYKVAVTDGQPSLLFCTKRKKGGVHALIFVRRRRSA
jgi:hypothetical protein